MSSKRKNKIPYVVVVAHDAGGAEIIAGYVRTHKNVRYCIYAEGPARKVFRRARLKVRSAPKTRTSMAKLLEKHRDAAYALLGTGWMTRIEWNALQQAKQSGIWTVVYLDSWMNYREVFGYPESGWQKNLPDDFWAGDAAAKRKARSYFPTTRVRLVPNQYFVDIVARYRALARAAPHKKSILYMSAHGRISETLLGSFLKEFSHKKIPGTVRVRLHPADNRATFEKIIRRARGVQVELSREKDIVQDLLRARVVLGPETVALVPAMMVGLKTVRIVPKGEKPFLPFTKITRVKSAAAAIDRIKG